MNPKVTGIVLIVASFALWGGALATPFVSAPLSVRAGAGISLYGLSYLLFGLGCRRLGSSVWPWIRDRWRGRGPGRSGA